VCAAFAVLDSDLGGIKDRERGTHIVPETE